MGYKWRPSKRQRREFAERMANDPEYRQAYYDRKKERERKRRESSKFDYASAGGEYIPTETQYNGALRLLGSDCSPEQENACNMVIFGFINKEKVHHDHIHIVNEFLRKL